MSAKKGGLQWTLEVGTSVWSLLKWRIKTLLISWMWSAPLPSTESNRRSHHPALYRKLGTTYCRRRNHEVLSPTLRITHLCARPSSSCAYTPQHTFCGYSPEPACGSPSRPPRPTDRLQSYPLPPLDHSIRELRYKRSGTEARWYKCGAEFDLRRHKW